VTRVGANPRPTSERARRTAWPGSQTASPPGSASQSDRWPGPRAWTTPSGTPLPRSRSGFSWTCTPTRRRTATPTATCTFSARTERCWRREARPESRGRSAERPPPNVSIAQSTRLERGRLRNRSRCRQWASPEGSAPSPRPHDVSSMQPAMGPPPADTTATSAPGTCRTPAAPRSCRTASWTTQ